MANESGVSGACVKLHELSLKDDIGDSGDKSNDTSLHEVDLNIANLSDARLQAPNDCSEFNFDNVIGHLEDMLIEKHWREFDDSEENKHAYMTIFNDYTNKIEDFIIDYLKKRIAGFDMDVFASELEKRKDTLEGEIFEVLLTLSDFSAFKEVFLDYRAMKEGHTIDPGESLSVSSIPL